MKLAQQGAGVGQLENTMKPSQTVVLIVLSSFALLVTSACNKSPADNSAKVSKPPEPIVVTSTPAVRPEADRKIILAAAERFENLTEAAFSGAQATTGKDRRSCEIGCSGRHRAGFDGSLPNVDYGIEWRR